MTFNSLIRSLLLIPYLNKVILKRAIVYVAIISLWACSKHDNPVPVTSVNYSILSIESDPRYSDIRTPGGSAVIESGSCLGYNCNGIILYRVKVTGEIDDFRAFDRTCPHEVSDCAMEINSAFPYILVCPCCGSEFNLEGAFMEKGPAEYPLREINCDFYNGDLRLY